MAKEKKFAQKNSLAGKLLVDALENFLGTCLKVLNYFPLEASKSFLSSYITVKHLQYVF